MPVDNNLNNLEAAQKAFIDHLRGQKRSISTILAYGKDVSQLVEFLKKKAVETANQISSEQLEEFKKNLEQKDYTLKSISRKLNSLKTFFRFLKTQGVIENDPATTVSHPHYEAKPPRILSKMEYRALRDASREDIRIAAIIELMLQTGIRIGEVSRIKTEDMKGEDIYIEPYQSQSSRMIPLNKAAKTALDHYSADRPQVRTKNIFVTKTGRPFLARNIRAAINRYFRIAGIENASVNSLRNTWLAHHLSVGTSPVFLAKVAGHKRLATTEKYLEYLKEGKEQGEDKGKTKLEEL
ncbi:MAG: tyrosine-type recombinase/integrase [bacterium]|nr:tyrosine-type recombinase/integrase [bacterium]